MDIRHTLPGVMDQASFSVSHIGNRCFKEALRMRDIAVLGRDDIRYVDAFIQGK